MKKPAAFALLCLNTTNQNDGPGIGKCRDYILDWMKRLIYIWNLILRSDTNHFYKDCLQRQIN